jgi:chromate transport protein ChrA
MDLDIYTYSDTLTLGFAIFHVVLAIALWKMAERTKTEPRWFALVPFLNIVLLLKIAKRPTWWLILFIVPFVNVITLIVATMALCERFGVNKWWGLASIVSPLNLILYLYLAYGTEKTIDPQPIAPAPHA